MFDLIFTFRFLSKSKGTKFIDLKQKKRISYLVDVRRVWCVRVRTS
jgi:hypothetical protein